MIGGIVEFAGSSIDDLTLSVTEGWNLISGLSTPVDVNMLYNSGFVVTNGIYNYDGSYNNPVMISPGMGYWLRASQDGEITLFSTIYVAKTLEQVNHLEGSNVLVLSNGDQSTILYFGKDVPGREEPNYSLPPVFPQMDFDARFNGDMKYAVESGEIRVINTSESLTINYDIVIDAGEHMNWILTYPGGEEYVLDGTGALEIVDPVSELTLARVPMIPLEFNLYQNYPNPFNPITTLRYDLPEEANVILTIYDLLGREVTQLVNAVQKAGFKSVQWNSTDNHGKPVSAGIYLYQIRYREYVQTRKMVLLK